MRKLKIRSSRVIILADLLLVISLVFVIFITAAGWAVEKFGREEKIYCDATIDDDFDPSCVLVVMDKHIGGINKQYEESFFGEIPIKSITDLTYITGDIEKKEYLDVENFHQILKIELLVNSKQNVIDTIRQLEKIDGILWAGPNYYLRMEI